MLETFSTTFQTVALPALVASCGEQLSQRVSTCIRQPFAYSDISQIPRINRTAVSYFLQKLLMVTEDDQRKHLSQSDKLELTIDRRIWFLEHNRNKTKHSTMRS